MLGVPEHVESLKSLAMAYITRRSVGDRLTETRIAWLNRIPLMGEPFRPRPVYLPGGGIFSSYLLPSLKSARRGRSPHSGGCRSPHIVKRPIASSKM